MAEGIHYVGTRYEELYDLFSFWGYVVIPDPTSSQWQEILSTSPLTGYVKLAGRRSNGDDTYMSFKVEEFWVKGDLSDDAVLVREGASLVRYHYHGQAPNGGMRWCLFPEGHPHDPCHVHPFELPEGGDPVECDPVAPGDAIDAFEERVYLDDFGPSDEE